MTTPKISLGSWAFSFGPFESAPWSWDRFVDFTADNGYDGVEINAQAPHPNPDHYDTPAKCRELMTRLADKGLGVSGYAVNGHFPDLAAAPPATAESHAGGRRAAPLPAVLHQRRHRRPAHGHGEPAGRTGRRRVRPAVRQRRAVPARGRRGRRRPRRHPDVGVRAGLLAQQTERGGASARRGGSRPLQAAVRYQPRLHGRGGGIAPHRGRGEAGRRHRRVRGHDPRPAWATCT